jgi:hypothetical protein
MDLDDIWQENKRWILGCIAGLLVFVIANSIIGGSFKQKRMRGATLGEKYKMAQLTKAKIERKTLDAELVALRAAMNHEVPKLFVRTGDPDLYWTETYSQLRKDLFDMAHYANVEFPEASLSWHKADDAAGIDRGLVGLSLVQHLVHQLLAAHKTVIEKDFDAMGVRSIGAFTPDRVGKGRARRRREGEPMKPEELLTEIKVGFKFEADNATVHRFIENCRGAKRCVTLGGIKITQGRQSGDPLTVSGEVIALTIKDIPKDI